MFKLLYVLFRDIKLLLCIVLFEFYSYLKCVYNNNVINRDVNFICDWLVYIVDELEVLVE